MTTTVWSGSADKPTLVAKYEQKGSTLVQTYGSPGAGFNAAQKELANKGITISDYIQTPKISKPIFGQGFSQSQSSAVFKQKDLRQLAKKQSVGLEGLFVSTGIPMKADVSAIKIQSRAPPGTIQFKTQQLKREEMPLAAKNLELSNRADMLTKEGNSIDLIYKNLVAKGNEGTLTQSDVDAYTTRATNYNAATINLQREIKTFEGKAEKFESKVEMFNKNEIEPYNKISRFSAMAFAPKAFTKADIPQIESSKSFAKKYPLPSGVRTAEFETSESMKKKYGGESKSIFDVAQINEPSNYSFVPKDLPSTFWLEEGKLKNLAFSNPPFGAMSVPQTFLEDVQFPFFYAGTPSTATKESSKAKRMNELMGIGGLINIGETAYYRAKQQYFPETMSEREYKARLSTGAISTAEDLALWQLAFGGIGKGIGKLKKGELKFLSESDVELIPGKGETAKSVMGTLGKGTYRTYYDLGIYGNLKLSKPIPMDFFQLEFGDISKGLTKEPEFIEKSLAKLLPKEPGGFIEFTPSKVPTEIKKPIEFVAKVNILEPTVSRKTVVGIVRVGGKKKVMTIFGGGGTSISKMIKGTKTVFDLPEGKDYVFEMIKGGKSLNQLKVSGGIKFAMGKQEEFDVALQKLAGQSLRGSVGKTKTTFLEAESAGLKGVRKTIGAPKTVVVKKGVPIDVFFEDIGRYKVVSKAEKFDKFVNDAMMGSRAGKGFKRTPLYSQEQILKMEAGGNLPTITTGELTKATQRLVKTVSKTKAKAITDVLIGGGGGTVAVQATKATQRKGVYIPSLMNYEESMQVAPGFGTSYAMGTAAQQKSEQKLRAKSLELLMPFQVSKELSKVGVKSVQKSSQRLKDITSALIGTMPMSAQKSKTNELTSPAFMGAQAVGVKTAILPIELAATKQKTMTGLNFGFPMPHPPIPKPKIFLFGLPEMGQPMELEKGKRKEKFNPGFFAYVKRRGKWLKTTSQPIPKIPAMSSGARTVDTFTQKSFTIRKANKPAIDISDDSWFGLQKKFRQKGNVFIEKNAFAIDSPEERAGIPFAGLAAKKRYAKLRRMGYL